MEEKYKLCDDTINKLLAWVGETEKKLANQEPVKENVDKLRNQINVLKVKGFYNFGRLVQNGNVNE